MKYMKLGSKPDIFEHHGNVVTAMNDLPPDLVLSVGGTQYHLHKYPLLLKCGYLRRMAMVENSENGSALMMMKVQIIQMKEDVPGGTEAFEVCAKFCYGIAVTVNAFNVVSVCCAAQHLEMTEEMEKGNLVFKANYFLDCSIFHAWKDSIISLQTTAALFPWAEDLKLVSRCIDAIVSKACVGCDKVNWSYTYTRPSSLFYSSSSSMSTSKRWDSNNGRSSSEKENDKVVAPDDWWAEDICRLDIDLYQSVLLAIKAKGRVSSNVIWQALMVYASRCLPAFIFKDEKSTLQQTICCHGEEDGHNDVHNHQHHHHHHMMDMVFEHKRYLEAIVDLLPAEKGPSSSCSFLLKLLKAASLLGASTSLKTELERRIAEQLEDASVNDLLIPSFSYASESLYDVDLIQSILMHFMTNHHHHPEQGSESSAIQIQTQERAPFETTTDKVDSCCSTEIQTHDGSSSSFVHSSMLKVAKLVDLYLAEIARDSNLTVSRFMELAELVPDMARPVHDSLYKAINVYLKEHGGLTKAERKKICRLLDCKKLSMEACMHAAQNECLPLRTVVQVLFFEQVRSSMAATSSSLLITDDASSIRSETAATQTMEKSDCISEEEWDNIIHDDMNAIKDYNMDARIAAEKDAESGEIMKIPSNSNTRRRAFQSIFLNKLLSALSRGKGSGMSYC